MQFANVGGGHHGHVVGQRHLPGDRVVAIAAPLQSFARDGARLGARHRDAFDQTLAFPFEVTVRVSCGGKQIGEHVNNWGRPAARPFPEISRDARVDRGAARRR